MIVGIEFRLKKCIYIIHIRFQRNIDKITFYGITNFYQVVLWTTVLDMNYPPMADIKYFTIYNVMIFSFSIKCYISNMNY